MPYPTLMVLDGEMRSTLGIVRSLGRRRIPVIVGSGNPLGRTGFSKYTWHRFSYPPADSHMDAAHASIMEQVRRLRPAVLMPVFDPGWTLVYTRYDDYADLTTVVPNPGFAFFRGLWDKSTLAAHAERCSVPIPRTYRPGSFEQVLEMADSLPYPVLLKPRVSVSGEGIVKADSARDLPAALSRFTEIPVIQEYIEGEDLELTILCNHGEPIAGSAYLSLRNAPLPYGPPVACRTIRDKTLMTIGMNFLRKIGYHGVAHLDFRRDRRDGTPKLLDFNPRIAGTNEISLASGVDFAFMLYQLAMGEAPTPCFDYSVDLEFRWILPGELRHFRQTDRKLDTLKQLIKFRNVKTEISLGDPLPHTAMFVDAVRLFFRKFKKADTQMG